MTTIEIRRTARVELDRHEYATVWHALRTLAAHLDPVTAPNQIERANKLADKLAGLAEQMGATSAGEATIPWGWSPDDRSRPLRPPASASPEPTSGFADVRGLGVTALATVEADFQADAVPGCIFASCPNPAIEGGAVCETHHRNPGADPSPTGEPDGADAPTSKGDQE